MPLSRLVIMCVAVLVGACSARNTITAAGWTDSPAMPSVTVTPMEDDRWEVRFDFLKTREAVLLPRAQDNYRAQSWESRTEGVSLVHYAGMDIIVFDPPAKRATFLIEPWTQVLPRDYTPALTFAPDGIAFHIDQFEMLDAGSLQQTLALDEDLSNFDGTEIEADIIFDTAQPVLAHGAFRDGPRTVSTVDDPGYVYVGEGRIMESERYGALLHRALPDWITADFDGRFNRIFDDLTARFGDPVAERITVLYSWEGDGFEGLSMGGSTLSGPTLTMAAGGRQLATLPRGELASIEESTLAHELAHLFQKRKGVFRARDPWLHEGHASVVSNHYMSVAGGLTERERTVCREGLSENPSLPDALDRMPYKCGAAVWTYLHAHVDGADIYALWDALIAASDDGRIATADLIALLDDRHGNDRAYQPLRAALLGETDARITGWLFP